MTAYAVALLRNVKLGPEIVAYLERIDATLAPFDGKFVIHGGAPTVLEGHGPGDLIMIEFPNRERARAWYESADYQSILALRRRNSEGDVILVDRVPERHRATDVLQGYSKAITNDVRP
jgi:uncharacterized protein (DUF1330 family)